MDCFTIDNFTTTCENGTRGQPCRQCRDIWCIQRVNENCRPARGQDQQRKLYNGIHASSNVIHKTLVYRQSNNIREPGLSYYVGKRAEDSNLCLVVLYQPNDIPHSLIQLLASLEDSIASNVTKADRAQLRYRATAIRRRWITLQPSELTDILSAQGPEVVPYRHVGIIQIVCNNQSLYANMVALFQANQKHQHQFTFIEPINVVQSRTFETTFTPKYDTISYAAATATAGHIGQRPKCLFLELNPPMRRKAGTSWISGDTDNHRHLSLHGPIAGDPDYLLSSLGTGLVEQMVPLMPNQHHTTAVVPHVPASGPTPDGQLATGQSTATYQKTVADTMCGNSTVEIRGNLLISRVARVNPHEDFLTCKNPFYVPRSQQTIAQWYALISIHVVTSRDGRLEGSPRDEQSQPGSGKRSREQQRQRWNRSIVEMVVINHTYKVVQVFQLYTSASPYVLQAHQRFFDELNYAVQYTVYTHQSDLIRQFFINHSSYEYDRIAGSLPYYILINGDWHELTCFLMECLLLEGQLNEDTLFYVGHLNRWMLPSQAAIPYAALENLYGIPGDNGERGPNLPSALGAWPRMVGSVCKETRIDNHSVKTDGTLPAIHVCNIADNALRNVVLRKQTQIAQLNGAGTTLSIFGKYQVLWGLGFALLKVLSLLDVETKLRPLVEEAQRFSWYLRCSLSDLIRLRPNVRLGHFLFNYFWHKNILLVPRMATHDGSCNYVIGSTCRIPHRIKLVQRLRKIIPTLSQDGLECESFNLIQNGTADGSADDCEVQIKTFYRFTMATLGSALAKDVNRTVPSNARFGPIKHAMHSLFALGNGMRQKKFCQDRFLFSNVLYVDLKRAFLSLSADCDLGWGCTTVLTGCELMTLVCHYGQEMFEGFTLISIREGNGDAAPSSATSLSFESWTKKRFTAKSATILTSDVGTVSFRDSVMHTRLYLVIAPPRFLTNLLNMDAYAERNQTIHGGPDVPSLKTLSRDLLSNADSPKKLYNALVGMFGWDQFKYATYGTMFAHHCLVDYVIGVVTEKKFVLFLAQIAAKRTEDPTFISQDYETLLGQIEREIGSGTETDNDSTGGSGVSSSPFIRRPCPLIRAMVAIEQFLHHYGQMENTLAQPSTSPGALDCQAVVSIHADGYMVKLDSKQQSVEYLCLLNSLMRRTGIRFQCNFFANQLMLIEAGKFFALTTDQHDKEIIISRGIQSNGNGSRHFASTIKLTDPAPLVLASASNYSMWLTWEAFRLETRPPCPWSLAAASGNGGNYRTMKKNSSLCTMEMHNQATQNYEISSRELLQFIRHHRDEEHCLKFFCFHKQTMCEWSGWLNRARNQLKRLVAGASSTSQLDKIVNSDSVRIQL